MIEYVGNRQTILFANWLLRSDDSPIDELMAEARQDAQQEIDNGNLDECDLDYAVAKELAVILESLTDSLFESFEEGVEYEYGADLFRPLLAQAFDKICYRTVAELVVAHYRLGANFLAAVN